VLPQVELARRVHRYVVTMNVEHGLCHLIKKRVVAVDLD
jgi:hypothetical protein